MNTDEGRWLEGVDQQTQRERYETLHGDVLDRCTARQLSELVALWGQDRAAAASCRRSVRMVWPELGERLDDLLDQQDGGGER